MMAEVLTQQQVDSPSQGPPAQEEHQEQQVGGGKRISAYDFKHPNRISKDQNRTLESVHTQFCNKFSSTLSGLLRAVVEVSLQRVDQVTYAEFINSLTSHSCTYTFRMAPLEGMCMADFSPTLTFAFVDRMFGGRGQGIDAERELTGIELSVMDKISRRAYDELSQAWKRLIEVDIQALNVETTPQFTQIVPPSETVIVVRLQLSMLEVTGVLTLCYPFLTLEPVLTQMSGQNWVETAKSGKSEQDRQNVLECLRRVETNVSIELARTAISMRDVLRVGVGDVIVTDTAPAEPAKLYVGRIEKFTARPGIRGKRRAVEIIAATEDENR
jgi:flagellar motor switch protein FliM